MHSLAYKRFRSDRVRAPIGCDQPLLPPREMARDQGAAEVMLARA
jgi:hypothetical protein